MIYRHISTPTMYKTSITRLAELRSLPLLHKANGVLVSPCSLLCEKHSISDWIVLTTLKRNDLVIVNVFTVCDSGFRKIFLLVASFCSKAVFKNNPVDLFSQQASTQSRIQTDSSRRFQYKISLSYRSTYRYIGHYPYTF